MRPISSRKLFDPRSTTASVLAVTDWARRRAARRNAVRASLTEMSACERAPVLGAPAFLLRSLPRPRPLLPVPIDYLQRILNAKVYDVAIESPLDPAPMLSRRLGNRVLLKREDEQEVFSFKLRGAYNRMAHLSAAERARGVVAASAGNHAQGVALAAQRLGCKATIVMPVTSPTIKIQAVEARGASVVLHGDSYSDAYAHAVKLQKAPARHVHPSVRRSRRDRGPGHDRGGNPAPVPGTARCDLRRCRRRRADRRHRVLRQARAPGSQGHRRAAGRLRRHDPVARRRTPRPRSRTSACSPTASRSSRSARKRFASAASSSTT